MWQDALREVIDDAPPSPSSAPEPRPSRWPPRPPSCAIWASTCPTWSPIERTGVAANWQASGGWTDGQHRLGTGPEKDVGFPYRSSLVPRRNAELDERMTRHSWQSYLIAHRAVRGVDRPRPARADAPPVEPVPALGGRQHRHDGGPRRGGQHLGRRRRSGRRWALHTPERTVHADAVMITGPGQAERSILPGNPRVLSIAQFWHRAAAARAASPPSGSR